jgi:hypothetical protein
MGRDLGQVGQASFVVLLGRYANWSGVSGIMVLMCVISSLSNHFRITDVSATGRSSSRQVTLELMGTGTMVVRLKHIGITDWDKEIFKICEDLCQLICACFENAPWDSGFVIVNLLNIFLTSAMESESTQ